MEEVLRPKNLHRLDDSQRLKFLSEIKGINNTISVRSFVINLTKLLYK